jgi:Flp pilus assembly protein TadG
MRLLNNKGQSIVEITLITPLILVALYVPFDFGVLIFTGHLTQNAVRDGARVASNTDTMTNAKATTLATTLFNSLPQKLVTGSTTKEVRIRYYATGAANCAEFVEVQAQGTYDFFLYRLMTLFGFSPPNSISITRTTRMAYQFQPSTNTGLCTGVTASGTHS